ncbi:MAG: TIGR03619 family F420-dependent LLM class oxidoreductase [Acidobacteria bacterium]|nr:TIGR03619 family F420-dependent LLM class oxidoreductase [Acidobacteriota bacterium]
MRFGVHLRQSGYDASPAALLHQASVIEELGYDSVWLFDHLIIPTTLQSLYKGTADGKWEFPPDAPYLEAVSVLAALAATTTRIRLGTRVLVPLYRPPVLLAKQLATIDAFSDGRLVLGFGTGWMQEEFEAVGSGFDRRLARFDEHISLLQGAWRDGLSSHDGEFYRHVEAGFFPRPSRPDHRIPILLGGIKDAILRRVAAYADGWAVFSPPSADHDAHGMILPELLEERLNTLHHFCDEAGRDFDELEIVTSGRFHDSPARFEEHAKLGVTTCDIVSFAPPSVVEDRARLFAEVVGTEM